MFTRDNLAISNPSFAAGIQEFNPVSEKEKKKQRAELAHLVSILKSLEGEVKKAKTKGKDGKVVYLNGKRPAAKGGSTSGVNPGNASNGPDNSEFGQAMAKLALILQMLQVELAKAAESKSNSDAKISTAQVNAANNALKDVEAAIAKLHKEEDKSKVVKFLEIFAAVLVSVVAACFGQVEVALAMIAMLALSQTGALNKATKFIAKNVFEKMGMSKDAAKICAAILVIIVVVVATMGFGAEAGAEEGADAAGSAAESAGSNALEMTDFSAQAAEEGAEIAEEGAATSSPLSILKSIRPDAITAMFGAQAVAGTKLVSTIADAYMIHHTNYTKEQRKKIEQTISEVVQAIAMVIQAIAGGKMAGASMAGDALKAYRATMLGIMAGQATASGFQGSYSIQQGSTEEELAEVQAGLQEIQGGIDMSSRQTREDQSYETSMLKNQNTSSRSLSKLMAGEAAIANLLTAHSPV